MPFASGIEAAGCSPSTGGWVKEFCTGQNAARVLATGDQDFPALKQGSSVSCPRGGKAPGITEGKRRSGTRLCHKPDCAEDKRHERHLSRPAWEADEGADGFFCVSGSLH